MDANYKLVDFQTCFRYSVAAKRSFLCICQVGDKKPEDIIKMTIENDYSCGQKAASCTVVSKISDLQTSYEEKDLSAESDDDKIVISIIPNMNTLPSSDQLNLVRIMNAIKVSNEKNPKAQTHVIIGIITWDKATYRREEKGSRRAILGKDLAILQPCIKLDDWLKHKFWLACSEPKVSTHGKTVPVCSNSSQDTASISPGSSIDSGTESSGSAGTIQLLHEVHSSYSDVYLQPVVRKYILDIIVHIRMHRLSYRAKGGGAHMDSLKDVIQLSKLISINGGKKYIIPRYIKQAAAWYFPMHLNLINKPERDNSILYGSKIRLVNELLDKIIKVKSYEVEELENPLFLESLVVQDVLKKVIPPV
ncbi:Mtc2p NDAI_0D02770 [Naumovozyma dairenensis CBS 421]|uniref:Maintenance of telomere capping protein 2 n=1 Tax=Naumovozyma dairenensis (strain ATCC 10597 / BCRC 20456 / CBS 421 / NBRC 0211 / NRRL Y-12639) TaxID=1071378 RepID=G0W9Y0_NAUDC|nr:hypothetical protein NDAI_0D02770 [Naumovozyma dairenensis CBS 421]CCD24591.1 hypothetical protein NDAI_0D02770 [Naumovozyma dairenensis CBS 421]